MQCYSACHTTGTRRTGRSTCMHTKPAQRARQSVSKCTPHRELANYVSFLCGLVVAALCICIAGRIGSMSEGMMDG